MFGRIQLCLSRRDTQVALEEYDTQEFVLVRKA